MRRFVVCTIATGLVASAGFTVLNRADIPPPDRMQTSAVSPEKRPVKTAYMLAVAGIEQGCSIVKGETLPAGPAVLELAGCTELVPSLSEAHYWLEADGGNVLFQTRDGRTIVEFFAGDGLAYESLRPIAPLLSLSAID